jgi:hypothetical protein
MLAPATSIFKVVLGTTDLIDRFADGQIDSRSTRTCGKDIMATGRKGDGLDDDGKDGGAFFCRAYRLIFGICFGPMHLRLSDRHSFTRQAYKRALPTTG